VFKTRGLFQKILADSQKADIRIPVVVGIVPIDIQVALAVVLVEVEIAELTLYARRIILITAP
jgi:hypothetical protein